MLNIYVIFGILVPLNHQKSNDDSSFLKKVRPTSTNKSLTYKKTLRDLKRGELK